MIFTCTRHSFLIVLLLASCALKQPQKATGILQGSTGIFEGNCMPVPGVKPCEARPISVTILITKPTKDFNNGLVVKRIVSDDEGTYQEELPAGSYSLFILDEDEVTCPLIQCPSECFCNPFSVVADSTTIMNANLDRASW